MLSVLASAALMFNGCATYYVARPSEKADVSNDSNNPPERRITIHALFWGHISIPPRLAAKDAQEAGIDHVIIYRNLGYDLISVLTLGIWMPLDVEYVAGQQVSSRTGLPDNTHR